MRIPADEPPRPAPLQPSDDELELERDMGNGPIVTGVGTPVIVGTQNLNYDMTDAKDDLIIRTVGRVRSYRFRLCDGL